MSNRKKANSQNKMNKAKLSEKKNTQTLFQYLLFTAFGIFFTTIIITQYNQNEQTHAQEKDVVTVYKSPTCGCCKEWVKHLKENGFKVKTIDMNNLAKIKEMAGIPPGAGSCHTAFINDYAIEGHVPANDIKKLLKEKRKVSGLTVPGMPMGSPGMEGHRVDKYSVYEFDEKGTVTEVQRY